MKTFSAVLLSTLLLLLGGCASVTSDIKTDAEVDPTVKLSGYKSYAWLGDAGVLNDPEGKWQPPKMNISENIKSLIDREMQKHGYYLYAENPDLAVMFFMGVDMENMRLKTDPNTQQDILKKVPAAGLVVALVDVKTEYVVWVGAATGELQQNPSDETIRKRLDYAVTQMFRKLPKD